MAATFATSRRTRAKFWDEWDRQAKERARTAAAGPEPIRIDSELEWADWTKQSWDLGYTNPEELAVWLAHEGVTMEHWQTLPASKAAPWLAQTAATRPFDPTKHERWEKGTKIRPTGEGGGRFRVRVGVTAYRPEDDPEGFFESKKFQQFEAGLDATAKEHGVTIDVKERAQGFWLGEQEPSLAIEAHDGDEGVRAFAEDVRSDWDQDGVLLFDYDDDGDSLSFRANGGDPGQYATALSEAGVQGATIHASGVEVIGDDGMIDTIETLRASLGIDPKDVVVSRGRFELVERG